jgi:AcrR family transcriptional regulator
MGELAHELGMSKKTLYQHFESKDALVLALVETWGARLEEGLRELRMRARTPIEYCHGTAELWIDGLSRFSSAFWSELQSDHPAAHAAFAEILRVSRRRTRERIGRHLRPGVNREVALEVLNHTLARAADPQVAARLGLSTRDTILASLDIWARGALRLARGRRAVSALRDPGLSTHSTSERKRP